jgi:hypothetical protein
MRVSRGAMQRRAGCEFVFVTSEIIAQSKLAAGFNRDFSRVILGLGNRK